MENYADKKTLEKFSSAITLSDMELYIFPELLYALVLANLMSPRIWKWKKAPWFKGLEKLGFSRQAQRLKQYIMEHYSFNLDLDTWGLTTKARELARFESFVETDFFSRSNALFGYEGDKYYYDIDIRRHFGLDKYQDEVIPYWKTETVEAMDAFQFKPGYQHGAGECVSLSALYAAAFYIVLGIPLEDIFVLATPLHSQNFVAREEGILTNNRRLVTKTMWFNGSELSTKARRALEHERVTIVSHLSGYIHLDYPQASIDPETYQKFTRQLERYLTTPITYEIFANFLRVHEKHRKYFQIEYEQEGHRKYLTAETLYRYEHGSKYRVGDKTRENLLAEVETEEFVLEPYPSRYVLNIIEMKLNGRPLFCQENQVCERLFELFPDIPEREEICRQLVRFTCTPARLPSFDKQYFTEPRLHLPPGLTRQEIITTLRKMRHKNPVVELAFYAGRQIPDHGWEPFLKACWERNPVSIKAFQTLSLDEIYAQLKTFPNHSIYDEDGLATPDEVVNYQRGDGLEKVLAFINIIKHRQPDTRVKAVTEGRQIKLWHAKASYLFETQKGRNFQGEW